MIEIGRLCVKIAGRDAGKKAVILEILDGCFVLIDGQTRRKRCNVKHLEPLNKVLKIKKSASHTEIIDALKKEEIEVIEPKTKESKQKPKKVKKLEQVTEKTVIKEKETKKEKPQKTEKKETTKPKKATKSKETKKE